jgi:alkylation response protein AidB-like acyl-CoA dehydrogenase
MGQHGLDTCEIFLDDVRVPAENLLGGVEGNGFGKMMDSFVKERLTISVTAIASAERAIELTLAHVKQREMFNQTLWDFQNTKFKMAECASAVRIGPACCQKSEGGPQHSTVHWRVEKQVGSESSLNIFPPRYKWRKYQARGVNARGSRLQFEVVYDHLQVSHENHFSFCSRVQNIITTSLFASFNNHSKALGWARIATIQVEKIKRSILIKRLKHINITGLLLAFDREL